MAGVKIHNEGELRKGLAEARGRLQAFRFAASGSKTRNVKEARGLRKEIARLLTELRRRSIEK